MAQAAPMAFTPPGAGLSAAKLSDRETFEIQQYEKIIRLRDAILSGTHPTLKAPSGSSTSLESLSLQKQLLEPGADAKLAGANEAVSSTASTEPTSSGAPELNPIFLEKSEPLVRAELHIQRQRLERAIKDEVEQRRAAKGSQAELISDLDVSDVLAKALALVQTTKAPVADGENLIANAETTSDSLDDSTFYSSRHDTPESHLTSRIRNQSEDIQATNRQEQHGAASGPAKDRSRPQDHTTGMAAQALPPRPAEMNTHATAIASLVPQMSVVPGLNNYVQAVIPPAGPSSKTVGRPDNQARLEVETTRQPKPASPSRQPNNEYLDSHPPSPLVRNHALQPVAPQPTHPSAVSALATASSSAQPTAVAGGHRSAVATPAQVAALRRTEPNTVTSPDSSSQGGKKKGKKKKRKADRQAPEPSEAAPYIKPEPKSPSPMTAPSYLRPNKRQRHDQVPPGAAQYEPRYEPNAMGNEGVQYITRQYREEPIPVGYARSAVHHEPPPGDLRYHTGEYYDLRQVRGEDLGPRPTQVEHPAMPYPATGTPASRPLSRVMVAETYPPPSRQYREYHDGSRIASHAEADRYIAPMRPAPTRILVDAYGREYIEPPQPPPSRFSAASPSRHGETEVLYERLPPRAVSRHPAQAPYEDGSVVYAAPNPGYVMPRRVVTQPEYAAHDYRDVHQREYSTRPPPQHGEYVQVVAQPERRYVDDAYGARQSSMRPVETVRYQLR
ncbi:hypothetical protein VFPPC_09090 [Pochonia chlamydosporia 170]|uniref:Uncharacterized protein n=1 Tax=Pochonia chlamydosporia 170 TaxID=1380566 RepID=A0A179FCX3_METCM|nr:hypothetical protein VFPPC_09090 [Pochonia chlamydosporia 170]OAQ63208.2 hypothetical protein VFPPC_09090 [Pochonia chlamydosporia 170]